MRTCHVCQQVYEGDQIDHINECVVSNRFDSLTDKKLQQKLDIAKKALEEINKEELNTQRPGGYYSKSAQISFKALKQIGEL